MADEPIPEPTPPPHNGHTQVNGKHGASGGAPKGNQNASPLARLIPPDAAQTAAIVEHAANCVVAGKAIWNARPLINPISDRDRAQLARFVGITADEFTGRLATNLRALADLTTDRIYQKLSSDQYKPHELSFLLTVAVDKLQRVEGRNLMNAANVNVQINNFGPQSKADILARLTGQVTDLPPARPSSEDEPNPST